MLASSSHIIETKRLPDLPSLWVFVARDSCLQMMEVSAGFGGKMGQSTSKTFDDHMNDHFTNTEKTRISKEIMPRMKELAVGETRTDRVQFPTGPPHHDHPRTSTRLCRLLRRRSVCVMVWYLLDSLTDWVVVEIDINLSMVPRQVEGDG